MHDDKKVNNCFIVDSRLKSLGLRFAYITYPYFCIAWSYKSTIWEYMESYKSFGAFGQPDVGIAYFDSSYSNTFDWRWFYNIEDYSIVLFINKLIKDIIGKENVYDDFISYLDYIANYTKISNFVKYDSSFNQAIISVRFSNNLLENASNDGFYINYGESNNILIAKDLDTDTYQLIQEYVDKLLCYEYESYLNKVISLKKVSRRTLF